MLFSTSCKHEQKLQLAYTFLCDSVDVLMCELFFLLHISCIVAYIQSNRDGRFLD